MLDEIRKCASCPASVSGSAVWLQQAVSNTDHRLLLVPGLPPYHVYFVAFGFTFGIVVSTVYFNASVNAFFVVFRGIIRRWDLLVGLGSDTTKSPRVFHHFLTPQSRFRSRDPP